MSGQRYNPGLLLQESMGRGGGGGKRRFTVVSIQTQSLFLNYHLLIIVLFSIWTIVNLLLRAPHPRIYLSLCIYIVYFKE